jgi:hypothetical protein
MKKQKPDDGKNQECKKSTVFKTFRKLYALKKACTVWEETTYFIEKIKVYFNQYAIRDCYS